MTTGPWKRVAVLLALVAAPAYAGGEPVTFPPALQGIWMTADEEGRAQCERYLAARAGDDDEHTYNQLVGAEVVSPAMLHSYSEYGEGNFYQPTRIVATGAQQWRVTADLGIDTWPDGDLAGIAELAVALDGDTLRWSLTSIDGEPVEMQVQDRYFRCAEVPADMYRR